MSAGEEGQHQLASSTSAEVVTRTSFELTTYARSPSLRYPKYAENSLNPLSDGNMVDELHADAISASDDEEIRPLMASMSTEGNSAIEIITELPANVPTFSASYRMPRSKQEKREKQMETDCSGLGDFLLWVWGGSRYSGIICMAFSSFIYSIMGLLVELFTVTSVPPSEIIFIRCTVIIIAAFIWIRKTGQPLFGLPHVRCLLVARAITGYLSLLGFVYSIQVLPLHDAIVLNFSTPFMTAILGRIILKEKWGVSELGGMVCSIFGISLIFHPVPLIQGQTAEGNGSTNVYKPGEQHYIYAILIALLAAAFGGANYCFIRAASKASEQPLTTVFAFAAFACPAAAIYTFSFQKFVVPDLFSFFAMIIVALLAFAAEVLLARGLQLEKAFRATSILYIEAFASYMLRIMILGQVPSVVGLFGVAVVAVSTMSVTYFGRDKVPESS